MINISNKPCQCRHTDYWADEYKPLAIQLLCFIFSKYKQKRRYQI